MTARLGALVLAYVALSGDASFVQESPTTPAPDRPMDRVLLKDYRPTSSLVTEEHQVARARYPVIDVHAHSYATSPDAVAKWVKTMDDVGIKTTIILTGTTGEAFDRAVMLYLKPYPDRFRLYCGLSTEGFEAPDYPQRAVAELVRCTAAGGTGVGEITEKGAGVTPNGWSLPPDRRMYVDDARLDLFWEKCAELGMPVNLHVADPPALWNSLDAHQEMPPFFQHYNLSNKGGLTYDELLARRDRVFARHRSTRFVAAHLANQGHDLGALAKVLERFPGVQLDTSARDNELGRQPRAAARFLSRYRHRVLFGSDMGMDRDMYQRWWRFLESADESIENWPLLSPLYALDLEPQVLARLYRDNYGALVRCDARCAASRRQLLESMKNTAALGSHSSAPAPPARVTRR